MDYQTFRGPIEGTKVRLRDFTALDRKNVKLIWCSAEVTRMLSPDRKTPAQAREWLKRTMAEAQARPRTTLYLAIDDRATGEFLGFVRVGESGEIGVAIREDRWGQGYASDAIKTATKHVADKYGLTEFTAAGDPDNEGIKHALENAGFAPDKETTTSYPGAKGHIRETYRLELAREAAAEIDSGLAL